MMGLTPRSHAHHFGATQYADHFLYRCYDADGVLLYVGCTADVKRRLAAHRGSAQAKASRWLRASMTTFDVEGPFRGREAGRAAERAAIQAEQPIFNYQCRANEQIAAWMTVRPVAAYLVSHGHQELAIATACTCRPEVLDGVTYTFRCEAHQADATETRWAS